MINARRLFGQTVEALDGHIGSIHDLYFDEQTWSVRYLVLDTGKWLPGRKVLLVPSAIVKPWDDQQALPVNLTMEQIKASPDIDTAETISRLAEESLHRHYRWLPYWDIAAVPVPLSPAPPAVAASEEERREAERDAEATAETRLRSAKELRGYHVQATDGEVGRVEEFLLDDACARILFLAIEVKGWFFGKEVLVAPRMVSGIDWATSTIRVDATRQAIKSAQEYHPAA